LGETRTGVKARKTTWVRVGKVEGWRSKGGTAPLMCPAEENDFSGERGGRTCRRF